MNNILQYTKKMHRAFERYPLEGKAKITDNLEKKSDFVSANLFNICPKGMYLESSTSPKQNSLIYIKIDDLISPPPVNLDLASDYLAKVRWSKRLYGDTPGFGLGVMILTNVCSMCDEKIDFAHNIWQIDDHSLLCHRCYQNLMQLQAGKNRQLIENFFNGNVF